MTLLIEIPNLDCKSREYCKLFENSVLNNKQRRVFKIAVAPMRFGKTYLMINHDIPFLLNHTNDKIVFAVCPVNGPIEQNLYELEKMCKKYGFINAKSDIRLAKKALTDGEKVVMHITNALAYVSKDFQNFYDWIISNNIEFATLGDECWWGNISDFEHIPTVSANPPMPNYKAVWYKTTDKLSKYSTHTYGYTATKTLMHEKQYLPIRGEMQYEIEFDVLDPKGISHRIAWFGNAIFHSDKPSVFGDRVSKAEALKTMIESINNIENITGLKRTAFIHCNPTYGEEALQKRSKLGNPIYTNVNTVELMKGELLEELKSTNSYKPTDEIGVVLSSEGGCYLFNIENKRIRTIQEDEAYDLLDDQEHPLRYILTCDMGKMGVTIQSLKEFFSVRKTNKENPDSKSSIVYGTNQAQGRTCTANPGLPLKVFFKKYGGSFHNVPVFPKELNTANFYLPDNKMMRDSIDIMKRDFMPTYEDYLQSWKDGTIDNKVCPTCGKPWDESFHETTSEEVEEHLDTILKVA